MIKRSTYLKLSTYFSRVPLMVLRFLYPLKLQCVYFVFCRLFVDQFSPEPPPVLNHSLHVFKCFID